MANRSVTDDVLVIVDRQSGEGIAYTCWETLEVMNAAEQVAWESRRHLKKATGAEYSTLTASSSWSSIARANQASPLLRCCARSTWLLTGSTS